MNETEAYSSLSISPGTSVLAVVAHPDDESFGLGAVISALGESGARVSVVCFTRGDASTLRGSTDDLGAQRTSELADAARVLGIERVELLDFQDGDLASVPTSTLVSLIRAIATDESTQMLLTFDEGGLTGHPDHIAATAAATAASRALGIPTLAWTLPQQIALTLSSEFGTVFVGRSDDQLDIRLTVNRDLQVKAAHCHPSQAVSGSPLWRRLELLGNNEWLRWLVAPTSINDEEA